MYLLYIDPLYNLLHIRLAGEFDEQQESVKENRTWTIQKIPSRH